MKDYVASILPAEDIKIREPLDRYTSFRTGGEADCMLLVNDAEQLGKLLKYMSITGNDYFLLGNGTNLLVSDRGYDGTVIKFGPGMSRIHVDGERVYVQAGALLSQTAKRAMEEGLSGLEFASGIPGSIGGGLVMNAGAYGGEMSQIVESVTVMNESGEIMELDCDTMEFGYRTSVIKNRAFVVLEAALHLQRGDKADIQAKMEEFAARRKEKQPLEYPSAGSIFKRPEGYFAGKLIMDSGMRGYRVGGAQVSEKHCGFIINTGNATSEDIAELMAEVQDRVKERFRVSLEPEIVRLGKF
ncbi:MAG: UDP-N-acetylmuramate dehydrogenase [Lachnospiraceae bacterium]|nr:UDP-N-acetylmuramate dehydrogenase [Lachnospiraceae bacterium]